MIKTCHGSNKKGRPSNGLPLSSSPFMWTSVCSIIAMITSGSCGRSSRSSRFWSSRYLRHAATTSAPAVILPFMTSSAYLSAMCFLLFILSHCLLSREILLVSARLRELLPNVCSDLSDQPAVVRRRQELSLVVGFLVDDGDLHVRKVHSSDVELVPV